MVLSRQGQGTAAGTIFNEKITINDFNRAQRAIQLLTAVGNNPDIKPDELDAETWKHLVLVSEAKRRSIKISDIEVTEQIRAFFSGKKGFDKERYQFWVSSVFRDQPRKFEEQMRDFLSVQKLINSIRPKLGSYSDNDIWEWYGKSFLGVKDGKEIDEVDKKLANFMENIDQWKKSFTSFKENEAISTAIDEIEKRATLKSYIPPRPSYSPPTNSDHPEKNKVENSSTPENKNAQEESTAPLKEIKDKESSVSENTTNTDKAAGVSSQQTQRLAT